MAALKAKIPIDVLDYPIASDTSAINFSRTAFTLDTGDYDGSATYELEVVYTNSQAAVSETFQIRNVTDVANINANTLTNNTTNPTRSITTWTPASGSKVYQLRMPASASANQVVVYSARVIITQNNTMTKTRICIPLFGFSTDQSTNSNTAAPDTTTSGSPTQGDQDKFALFHLNLGKLSNIASTNPYTFEANLRVSASSNTISAAIYNTRTGNQVASSLTTHNTTTMTQKILNWVSDTDWIDGDNYEVRFWRSAGSTGNAELHSARLYIRLNTVHQIQTFWRMNKSLVTMGSFDVPHGRVKIDKSSFVNYTTYWDVTGREKGAGTGNIELINSSTQDSGTGGASGVTSWDPGSGTKSLNEVEVSLTDANRYYTKANMTSGELASSSSWIRLEAFDSMTFTKANSVTANILVADNTQVFDNSVKANIEPKLSSSVVSNILVVNNAVSNNVKSNILVVDSLANNFVKANIEPKLPNFVNADIKNTYTQDNSVIGNVVVNNLKANHAKANILFVTNQNNSVKADIKNTYTQDSNVKADILVTYTQANSVKANILVVDTKVSNNVKTNILASISKDSNVKADILRTYSQDSNVIGNILVVNNKQANAVTANVLVADNVVNNSVKGFIVRINISNGNSVKANILVANTTQANSVKANIPAEQKNYVKANILVVDNTKDNNVKASIKNSITQDSNVKANILAVLTQRNSVVGNILVSDITKNNSVKANITVTTSQDGSVKSNIKATTTQANSVIADIFVVNNTKANSSKANILVSDTIANNNVKADIKNTYSQDSNVIADIRVNNNTVSNAVKANINVINTVNNSVKANILTTYAQDSTIKADIIVLTQQSNSIKADINVTNSPSNSVKANFFNIRTHDNAVKANIILLLNNFVKSNIKVTTRQNNSVIGYIESGRYINYSMANIKVSIIYRSKPYQTKGVGVYSPKGNLYTRRGSEIY